MGSSRRLWIPTFGRWIRRTDLKLSSRLLGFRRAGCLVRAVRRTGGGRKYPRARPRLEVWGQGGVYGSWAVRERAASRTSEIKKTLADAGHR